MAGNGGESGQTSSTTVPPAEIVQYSDPLAASDEVPEEIAGDAVGTGGAEESAGANQGTADSPESETESATEEAAGQEAGEPSRTATSPSQPLPVSSRPPSQGDLLSMLERAMEPSPARSSLLAIRDTAVNAWGDESINSQHRALAAYVAGSTLVALGDTAQAVTWLQRAVDLRPGYDPYLTDLSLYRRLLSGDSPSYTPPAPY